MVESGYNRGFRAITVRDRVREELRQGASTAGFPSVGDYLLSLHRAVLAQAEQEGVSVETWLRAKRAGE
jgi:hypothetical protein